MLGIPPELLIHSCVLMVYERGEIFGERILKEEIRLSRVRVQLSRRVRADRKGYGYGVTGKLFYDCTASMPSEVDFLQDGCESVILYRGREYPVKSVGYIYDDVGLHHLEIELGGG